jgi:hypothetical protein
MEGKAVKDEIVTCWPFTIAFSAGFVQVFAEIKFREDAEEMIRLLEISKAVFQEAR